MVMSSSFWPFYKQMQLQICSACIAGINDRVVWMLETQCVLDQRQSHSVPDSLADTVYHLETTDDVLVIETDASSISFTLRNHF